MRQSLVAVVLGMGVLTAVPPADALDVLVFNSTRYVDSGQVGYAIGSQESDNVQAALTALGHTVSTIAGPDDPVGDCPPNHQPGTLLATAAEYGTALAATKVFLVPEQESYCYLPGDLQAAPDIVAAWRQWVTGGGGFVIHSSVNAMQKVDDLFSVVFGFRAGPPVAGVDGTLMHRTPAAASTHFAAGPETITVLPSTGLLPLSALPPGAVSVYDDGTNAAVAIIPFGSGKIVFLGWDWTKSNPPFADGQNGGWFPAVLDGAVREAAGTPPPPTHLLTVSRAGNGAGAVTSAPAGIDCGSACAHAYPGGTTVTLTATAAPGSHFAGWSGGCVGTGACVVTLSADAGVTATFTMVPPPPAATLGLVAPADIRPGEMLAVDLVVANPGPARTVDVYFGVLLPPDAGPRFGCPRGDALAFMGDGFGEVALRCASSPADTVPALFRSVTLPGGLSPTEVPDFWSVAWVAGLPEGTYTVFAAFTTPGALADGRLDPGDLLSLATRAVVAAP